MRKVPQFFERAEPNALHQVDLVENEKTAIGTVQGIFQLDDYSRYCVAGGFFFDKSEEHVLAVGIKAATEHGLPLEMLSDNGSQFRLVSEEARAEGGQTRYELGWTALGTKVTFAGVNHPQTKGKEVRFQRFMEEDFLNEVRNKVTSLEDLNERWERWRGWYNEEHEHSALGFRPPTSRYRDGMKPAEGTVWQAFAKEETRKVRLDGKIQVGKDLYQLPKGWEHSRVRVYRLGGKMKVFGGPHSIPLGEWQV